MQVTPGQHMRARGGVCMGVVLPRGRGFPHGEKKRVLCFVVLSFDQFSSSRPVIIDCIIVCNHVILVLEQGVATGGEKHLDALFIAPNRSLVKGGVPIFVLNVDAGWTCSNYQLQLPPSRIVTCSVMRRGLGTIRLQFARKKNTCEKNTPSPAPRNHTIIFFRKGVGGRKKGMVYCVSWQCIGDGG